MLYRIDNADGSLTLVCGALAEKESFKSGKLREGVDFLKTKIKRITGEGLEKMRKNATSTWGRSRYVGKPMCNLLMRRFVNERGFLKIFSPEVLQDAIKHNIVPIGYEMHHAQPLALGGRNTESNFILIEEYAHTLLHKHVFDAVQKALEEENLKNPQRRVYMMMPILPAITTNNNLNLFLTRSQMDVEAKILVQQEEKKEGAAQGCLAQKKQMQARRRTIPVGKRRVTGWNKNIPVFYVLGHCAGRVG